MGWFKKKTNKDSAIPVRDAAARVIAGWIIRLQLGAVKALQQVEQRLTLRQKKIALLLFCVAFSSCLGYILADALFRRAPERITHPRGMPAEAQPPPLLPKKEDTKHHN